MRERKKYRGSSRMVGRGSYTGLVSHLRGRWLMCKRVYRIRRTVAEAYCNRRFSRTRCPGCGILREEVG